MTNTGGKPDGLARAARGMAAIAADVETEGDLYALAYLGLYCCGYAGRGPVDRFRPLRVVFNDHAFVHELLERIPDREDDCGWKVTGQDRNGVLLERDGIRAWAAPDLLTPADYSVGHHVAVAAPALRYGASPGFVSRGSSRVSTLPLRSRLYLNIRPSAAAWAMGTLARALEARFTVGIKVLSHPRAYMRRDSCVVYTSSDDIAGVYRVIRDEVSRSNIRLNASVPLFTKKLAPGIGFADDVPASLQSEVSYGGWVSGLFADAATRDPSPANIATTVISGVVESDRDPRFPYRRLDPPTEIELP